MLPNIFPSQSFHLRGVETRVNESFSLMPLQSVSWGKTWYMKKDVKIFLYLSREGVRYFFCFVFVVSLGHSIYIGNSDCFVTHRRLISITTLRSSLMLNVIFLWTTLSEIDRGLLPIWNKTAFRLVYYYIITQHIAIKH